MQPVSVVVSRTSDFSDEMDRLRSVCFPGSDPSRSSRDEFDSRSIYVVNEVQGKLAAYGRLTPGPRSVFETWSQGVAQIPTGPNVADLGRCMVAPEHRGLDLITLVCLDGLLLAAEMGFDYVVGAVVPGRKLAAMLYEIGFRDSGPIVQSYEENGAVFTLQPLVAACTQSARWEELRQRVVKKLAGRGYAVIEHDEVASSHKG